MIATITFKEESDIELVESVGGKIVQEFKNIPRLLIVDITDDMANKLESHPSIDAITPDAQKETPMEISSYKEDTAHFANHLNALRATEYWERGITGKGVKVGILDYAVGYHHSLDIAGGINLQYPDKGFAYSSRPEEDYVSHGSFCAGLLAGKPVVPTGSLKSRGMIGGIAPDVELYAVTYGSLSIQDRARAIDWCIEEGLDAVSISMEFQSTPDVDGVMYESARKAGLAIFSGSGNDNSEIKEGVYPASSKDAIVVSGLNTDLTRRNYNYGDTVMFTAIAQTNVSLFNEDASGTKTNNTYRTAGGTSGATPMVAGVYALYKQAFPNKSMDEIIHMMAKSAMKINGNYWDKYVGYGMPQPSREILSRPKLMSFGGIELSGNGDYIDCGNSASLNIKNNLTISARVKQKPRNTGHIFAKTNQDKTSVYYGMLLADDGIYPEWMEKGVQKNGKLQRSLSDLQEHEITVVYDYPNVKLYIDGKLIQKGASVFSMSSEMDLSGSNDRLIIGGTANDSFAGTVYDVKVYDRSLNNEDVKRLYDGEELRVGMQLHYKFTGGENGVVKDLSGKDNDGVIHGAKSQYKLIDENSSIGTSSVEVPTFDVTDLKVTELTDHSIKISWSHSQALSSGRKYEIYQDGVIRPIATTTGTTATIDKLESDMTYKFKVVTINHNGSPSIGVNLDITTKKDTTPPAPVKNLEVVSTRGDSIVVSWDETTEYDVLKHGYYEVYVGLKGTSFSNAKLIKTNLKDTTYNITDVIKGETYDIWIVTVDGGKNKSQTMITAKAEIPNEEIIFLDTFNKENNTTNLGVPMYGGSWKYMSNIFGITDGKAHVTKTYPDAIYTNPAYTELSVKDYTIETEIFEHDSTVAGGSFAIMVRYSDVQNFIVLMQFGNRWFFSKFRNGTFVRFGTKDTPMPVSEGYIGNNIKDGDTVKIENRSNGAMSVYINDELLITHVDTDFLGDINKVGFGSGTPKNKFEYFRVSTPLESELTLIHYDSFNRDDSSLLGAPDFGEGYQYIDSTTYGIKGNRAIAKNSPLWVNPAYVTVDYPNFAVELTVTKMGQSFIGLFPRLIKDKYDFMALTNMGNDWLMFKNVGGKQANWQESSIPIDGAYIRSGVTPKDGDRVRIENYADGHMIVFVDGVEIMTIKDMDLLTNIQKVGFGINVNDAEVDDFKIEKILSYKG